MVRLYSLLALLLLCGCTPRTQQVDNQYVALLQNRLQSYRDAFVSVDTQARTEIKDFTGFIQVSRPPDETGPRLKSIADKIVRANEIRARGTTLEQFLNEAASSGRVGFMTAWLQNQYRTVLDLDRKATEHAKAFFSGQSTPDMPWYQEFEAVLTERGIVNGSADELGRLSNDLNGYARDFAAADQADKLEQQRMMMALSQMAAYYQAQTYQQQQAAFQQNLLMTLNRPRNCWVNGAFITCS
jgi:hypothetical protein